MDLSYVSNAIVSGMRAYAGGAGIDLGVLPEAAATVLVVLVEGGVERTCSPQHQLVWPGLHGSLGPRQLTRSMAIGSEAGL